jgi:hypothetical protein
VQEFYFEGCDRVRRNRKAKYITVVMGFPSRRWGGVGDDDIRKYTVLASIGCGQETPLASE